MILRCISSCGLQTPGGKLGFWTEEQFINTIRNGVTPGGHLLTERMPWKTYSQMNDEELEAIWQYLRSLPKLEQWKN
jgi:hypothetical protein